MRNYSTKLYPTWSKDGTHLAVELWIELPNGDYFVRRYEATLICQEHGWGSYSYSHFRLVNINPAPPKRPFLTLDVGNSPTTATFQFIIDVVTPEAKKILYVLHRKYGKKLDFAYHSEYDWSISIEKIVYPDGYAPEEKIAVDPDDDDDELLTDPLDFRSYAEVDVDTFLAVQR